MSRLPRYVPKPKRPIYQQVIDGKRISICEANDGSWLRITVPADPDCDMGWEPMQRGHYDPETGVFIEWTEEAS